MKRKGSETERNISCQLQHYVGLRFQHLTFPNQTSETEERDRSESEYDLIDIVGCLTGCSCPLLTNRKHNFSFCGFHKTACTDDIN